MLTGQESPESEVDSQDDAEEVHREEREAWEAIKKDKPKEEKPVTASSERTAPPKD